MKFLRDESGQMLVLTALSMTALLGFLALSTDVGMLFHTRRNLQIAADAAATAGALNISYGASAVSCRTGSRDCERCDEWGQWSCGYDQRPPDERISPEHGLC